MSISSLYFLVIFFISFSPAVMADSGKDRCKTIDCLCYVRNGESPASTYKTSQSKRRHMIYFKEDVSSVSQSESIKILSSLDKNKNITSITIMGYTDGCGSSQYNKMLSSLRAQSIKSIIKKERPSVKINTVVGGEKVDYHSRSARRVDIIFHTSNSLLTRIEKIPADVYLIDGSGSMWENQRKWKDLVNVSFRPGSKIYMSMMKGCYGGQNINNISPQGGTEIWYSYYAVIDKMNRGETLLIISDFQSNYPLTSREAAVIRNKVKEKNIKVITLQ